jgi:hypothetical protein
MSLWEGKSRGKQNRLPDFFMGFKTVWCSARLFSFSGLLFFIISYFPGVLPGPFTLYTIKSSGMAGWLPSLKFTGITIY